MPEDERRLYTALRAVYGPALLNGPFAVVLGMAEGMVALNDRIKLRPLVAARKGSMVYVASEESAIREICPRPDRSWMPRAGEPVVARSAAGGRRDRLRTAGSGGGGMTEITFTRPEFRVRIDKNDCIQCGRCVHQCGWGVYRMDDTDEYPVPDHAKCGACHRCVTFCPGQAITIEKNPLAYKESDSLSSDLRKAIWRQAETGGVLLTGMGNDKPYLRIFDHLLLDACQVTNPSIDPLREPMELRTFLGPQARPGRGRAERCRTAAC